MHVCVVFFFFFKKGLLIVVVKRKEGLLLLFQKQMRPRIYCEESQYILFFSSACTQCGKIKICSRMKKYVVQPKKLISRNSCSKMIEEGKIA